MPIRFVTQPQASKAAQKRLIDHVFDAMAHEAGEQFRLSHANVDPSDDLFLCEELDTGAQYWRNIRDAERFIRCNVKERNRIRVWDCFGNTRKLVYGR